MLAISMRTATNLVIFAKQPCPGKVKTRLCPPLSGQEAAEVHSACLRYTCQIMSLSPDGKTALAISPDEPGPHLLKLIPEEMEIWPQGDGDLGARLCRCQRRAYSGGAQRVIFIGADSPTMPVERLCQAVGMLADCDVILGPCEDGGFYLLGLSQHGAGLYADVAWGGPEVSRQLCANAARLGLRVGELDPWYDIDRPADLHRALHDLESAPAAARGGDELPATLRRVLASVAARETPT